MLDKKNHAILGMSLFWGALVAFSPGAQASKIGELSDSSSSILALCQCASSEEAAKSPNCRSLLAAQNPERQQQAPAGQNSVPGIHALMGPQGR